MSVFSTLQNRYQPTWARRYRWGVAFIVAGRVDALTSSDRLAVYDRGAGWQWVRSGVASAITRHEVDADPDGIYFMVYTLDGRVWGFEEVVKEGRGVVMGIHSVTHRQGEYNSPRWDLIATGA